MHVIAPSLPQWDGSSKYLDVSHYVELIEELLAVLRLSKVVMAGNSMGGLIAMQIAATKHGMIRALILEDSATGSEEEESILSERIDKSGIPVLIIWGREDKIIPVAIAERLHSKMTKSDLTILDETGHVPHWESPELFNIKVLNFLKLL